MTSSQQYILAYFIALHHFRIPKWRDPAQKILKKFLLSELDELSKNNKKMLNLKRHLDNDRLELEVKEWSTLQFLPGYTNFLCNVLLKKPWSLVRAPDTDTLLTNDAPVNVLPVEFLGANTLYLNPFHHAATIYFPLTNSVGLKIMPYNALY